MASDRAVAEPLPRVAVAAAAVSAGRRYCEHRNLRVPGVCRPGDLPELRRQADDLGADSDAGPGGGGGVHVGAGVDRVPDSGVRHHHAAALQPDKPAAGLGCAGGSVVIFGALTSQIIDSAVFSAKFACTSLILLGFQ